MKDERVIRISLRCSLQCQKDLEEEAETKDDERDRDACIRMARKFEIEAATLKWVLEETP